MRLETGLPSMISGQRLTLFRKLLNWLGKSGNINLVHDYCRLTLSVQAAYRLLLRYFFAIELLMSDGVAME